MINGASFSINSMNYLFGILLGLISGGVLTLMDRIDEHHIIERNKTPFAYLTALLAAASAAWSIEIFPVIYPFAFGLSIEWIVKNKIDFPSHVLSLFLMAMYFGLRLDLFFFYAPYIAFFLLLRYVSGTYFRKRLTAQSSRLIHWYYDSYMEKFVGNILLALALQSLFVIFYGAAFAVACYQIKRLFPGINNLNQTTY
jgi:hypothetical protein